MVIEFSAITLIVRNNQFGESDRTVGLDDQPGIISNYLVAAGGVNESAAGVDDHIAAARIHVINTDAFIPVFVCDDIGEADIALCDNR